MADSPAYPSSDDRSDEDFLRSDKAVSFYYEQLRLMARRRLQRAPLDSLQATELVHEMYQRITARGRTVSANRYEFFATASRAMEDILVERARAAVAQKRGGGQIDLTLSSAIYAVTDDPSDLVHLHQALARLHDEDPLAANVVRLRFFVGFTGDETAEALGVSSATVDRRWAYARAWLHEAIFADEDDTK